MLVCKLCMAACMLAASLFGSPAFGGTSLDALLSAKAKSDQIPSGRVPSGRVASGQVGAGKVHIAPIRSHPHGKSYAQWAAAWWRWALETTTDDNPVLDTTGEDCAVGQREHVWFLAGTFGSDPVVRTCTIPTGTALFFPLVNNVWLTTPGDPLYGKPPGDLTPEELEELRGNVACVRPAAALSLTVDGEQAKNLSRFFVYSVPFEVTLPADNILGVGPLTLGPNVDAGYYVFLNPLPPGEHTIHWEAQSGCEGAGTQDITYHLTVEPGRGQGRR